MKYFVESKDICGNFIWDDTISSDLKLDIINLFKSLFEYVSCFPEGDGICCSLNKSGSVNLNYNKRKELFLVIDNFFLERDIEWFTNIISEKEIAFDNQLQTQLN